jgi:hypothetical protein
VPVGLRTILWRPYPFRTRLVGFSMDAVWHKTGFGFIEPDLPVRISPAPDDPVDPATLEFSFTSHYTPSGKYRVQLQGQNLHEATIPGNPGGTTSFDVGVFGLTSSSSQPGTTYQWRARAHADHNDIDVLYPWGPWWQYATAPAAPPSPIPNPICPTGGEQIPGTDAYFAWSEVPGATQYKFALSNIWEVTYNLNELDGIEDGRGHLGPARRPPNKHAIPVDGSSQRQRRLGRLGSCGELRQRPLALGWLERRLCIPLAVCDRGS